MPQAVAALEHLRPHADVGPTFPTASTTKLGQKTTYDPAGNVVHVKDRLTKEPK